MSRIDWRSSVRLTDDLLAVVLVGDDGGTALWIDRGPERDDLPSGCTCSCCVPHEQVGRLPRRVAQALGLTCPAIKSDGTRCRMVTRAGEFCRWHGGAS